MYNYGITSFLNAKSVSPKKAVQAFLEYEKVTEFNYKNHDRSSDYVQKHWERFATFVDHSIRNGSLNGQAVKLNSYFQEEQERKRKVKAEYNELRLSRDEKTIVELESYDWGIVQSFMAKKGLGSPKKDYSYTSRKLQRMPYILLLREHGLIEEAREFIREKLKQNREKNTQGT